MFKSNLASEEAVKRIDDVLKNVDDLQEAHAKAFLKLIYARLDIVQNGNGEYTSEQCVTDLITNYKDLIKMTEQLREEDGSVPDKL
ncbi:hypothetical protein WAK64_16270 [Bacillus spongiae]|uniref:Uncharacterized protein n=1 Tax=Bacillus spongiae TaxID=2683610 RepID=A0ABU8HGU3_9BACI